MGRLTGGNRAVTRVGALVAALLVVVATVAAGFALGVLGTPSVVGVSNHFGAVTAETTTIETDVVVNNPNPVGGRVGDVSIAYAVDINDVRMATGRKDDITIGRGNSTVGLSTRMRNERIPAWWVTHLRNGEHSELVVHATVTSGTLGRSVEAPKIRKDIDTDIASSFNTTETRPIEADRGPLVQDPVLSVEETSGWWSDVTREETTVAMRFRVHNPKPYPIPLQAVRYDVDMNGVDVGSGGTDRSYVLPPGGTRTVAAELTLENDRLDEWWVSHLRRNQETELALGLSLVVDLSNVPGGGPTVALPVDTIEHTFETDVFGNKGTYPTGSSGVPGNTTGAG